MNPPTPHDPGVQKLLDAVRLGELARITRLLDDGVSVDAADSNGKTVLMVAAHEGLAQTMGLLLARGARVDLVSDTGDTALHWSVETNDMAPDEESMKLLLAHGANINAKNHLGQTPLLKCVLSAVEHYDGYAEVADYCPVMTVLMANGADMGVVDDQGRSLREIMEANAEAFIPAQARRVIAMIEADGLQARTPNTSRSAGARRI